MSKDFAFLFMPGDYLRDTQCLSEKTQVAYDRIMCEHMRNICISKSQLNFFTKRLSPEEKQELLLVLSEDEKGYFIDWVRESISKRIRYSDSRKKNRQGKGNNICETYVSHMENENEYINENNNKEEEVKEKEPKIDYQNIIDNYHHLCPTLNKVVAINEIRKGYMNARVGEYGIDKVISVIRMAGESKFLTGQNEKAWKADFEWILRPSNFLKILEGKYNNGQSSSEQGVKTYEEMLKISERDPGIWSRYKAIKKEGERKAIFVLIQN